ncbi:PQQ-like domain-containing protein [Micromonospora pattaloongensis]|uniref:PQQ-like domain-containing protein n=2 Tax=Micromonospora pattaloongensis TaxID=405436 RepID=A0A1H3H5H4_9ACTN|nr:PQQ-like domain-containing protein [Micromonospora pattaloongensis]
MKCYVAFAATVLIVLVATNVWNPFPDMWGWVGRTQPMSEPDVAWQQRIGGTPKTVTITDTAVVVEERLAVEARSLASGVQIWRRKADWAAVAGDGPGAVVAIGQLLVKGYEVLDPATGAVRRRDSQAVAVWSYRDALLDVRCSGPTDCLLTAWAPRGSTPLWTAPVPGIGFVLFADNPELRGTRPLTTRQVATQAGGPEPMPPMLGFPVDGRVHVLDTALGRFVQQLEPGQHERISVVGGRVLHTVATSDDGTCYFTVEAYDPANGQRVWRRVGINLRTANGAGCPHRDNPTGTDNVLVGVTPERLEVVLDAYDGRTLWTGAERETLLAVDDRRALVRSADNKTIKGYELGVPGPRWTRPAEPETSAGLARYAAVLVERKANRIIALDPRTGRELINLHSSAKVLALGPGGMVIGEGREIGYVRFGTVAVPPGRPRPGGTGPPPGGGVPDPGDGVPGPGPGDGEPGPCGGPKEPRCPSAVPGRG